MASPKYNTEKVCTTHAGEPLRFYCTSHNSIVCCICAVKNHRPCNDVLTFSEAIERFEREDKNLFKALENQGNAIEVVISNKNTELGYLGTNVEATKAEINDLCERLHDVVNDKKKVILSYVDEVADDVEKKITADIEALHSMLASAEMVKKHAEQAFEKRSALGIIQTMVAVQNMYCDLERSTKDVKLRPRQCLSFQQSDQIHEITENFQTLGFVSLSNCEPITEMDRVVMTDDQTETEVNPLSFVHFAQETEEQQLGESFGVQDFDFNFVCDEMDTSSRKIYQNSNETEATNNVTHIQPGPRVKFVHFAPDVEQKPVEGGYSLKDLEFNFVFDETETSTEDDMDDSEEHMTSGEDNDVYNTNNTTDAVSSSKLELTDAVANERVDTVTKETVTSFQTVDHVKPCWLYGITYLTTDRLAVTDVAHDSIQVFTGDGELVCETNVQFTPWDITRVGSDRVAVSSGGRGNIYLFHLNDNNLSATQVLHIEQDCICLSYAENMFIVGTKSGVVMVTAEGEQVKLIDKYINGGENIKRIHFVTTDTTNEKLYLTNTWRNEVVSINHEGQRSWGIQGQGLNPRGVAWHQDSLFVCNKTKEEILVVDADGKIVREIASGKLKFPYAMSHHISGKMVAVTQWDENIDVDNTRTVKIVNYNTCI